MCGEKKLAQFEDETGEGSPPHVRGKGFVSCWCPVSAGITPACAGKSFSRPKSALGFSDHPRMCGEKLRRAKAFHGW